MTFRYGSQRRLRKFKKGNEKRTNTCQKKKKNQWKTKEESKIGNEEQKNEEQNNEQMAIVSPYLSSCLPTNCIT